MTLAAFMRARAAEAYEEKRTDGHDHITAKMAELVAAKLQPGASILDVGCGQGPALEWFTRAGFKPVGIAMMQADVDACAAAGFDAWVEDMNEMTFRDGMFACVWARHVLEHSIAPLWTLTEFARVLAPGGILYAEMPAPDTSCQHQNNSNHYSVLGASAWASLISRAGFGDIEARTIKLKTPVGPDEYLSFIATKL